MILIDPVFAEYRIVDIAGVLTSKGAGTHRHSVAQRNVGRTAKAISELGAVMNGAGTRLDTTAHRGGRRIDGYILDQSAHATGAIERALRSAKHLYPCQI